jgi:spermidine synthase
VIDDGRRYLSRCGKKFDIITVDPPPPVEAAGSSLLFSTDFYGLAKEHLNTGGIVQMWYPGRPDRTAQAVARSMYESFPYVRCFNSVEGWGWHLVGSMQPIDVPSADQIDARMPATAKLDVVEWSQPQTAQALFKKIFDHEVPMTDALNLDAKVQITDDRPLNEYYLLRQMTAR